MAEDKSGDPEPVSSLVPVFRSVALTITSANILLSSSGSSSRLFGKAPVGAPDDEPVASAAVAVGALAPEPVAPVVAVGAPEDEEAPEPVAPEPVAPVLDIVSVAAVACS